MRIPLLALVLVLPNAMVLAGAINAHAAPPRKAIAVRPSPLYNARAESARASPSTAIANEVRKDERFVSFLLRKETHAIAVQERSLRDLGRLEAQLSDLTRRLKRTPRSHSLSQLIDLTGRRIGVLVGTISRGELQITNDFAQEGQLLNRIELISPQAPGLQVLLRRMADQFRAIERDRELEALLGLNLLLPPAVPTPTFPPGKTPASPVQP